MKSLNRLLLCLILIAGLAGCLPLPTPLPPLPTDTPPAPTETTTPTPVWFPVTPTFTPAPSPTVPLTPTVDISPQKGALLFSDSFTDQKLWTTGRSPAGSIAYGKGELSLVLTQPRGYLFSLRNQPILGDFYAEITASPSTCRGADEYGLLLRFTKALDFYRFAVTCEGKVRVDRLIHGQASSPKGPIYSGAVPLGAPSQSRLAVVAAGDEMNFFANDQFLFTVHDPSIAKGSLGVFVRAAGEDGVTVSFSDLSVYAANP